LKSIFTLAQNCHVIKTIMAYDYAVARQFNSRLDDGTDCGLWIVREGLSCGSWAEFAASDEGECGIPDVGEVLRGASGSHPVGVLGEVAVPDEEEAVASRPEGLHLRPLSER
jgi:hypothetical protein